MSAAQLVDISLTKKTYAFNNNSEKLRERADVASVIFFNFCFTFFYI